MKSMNVLHMMDGIYTFIFNKFKPNAMEVNTP